MISDVIITRLCPRWNLPHACGDVPHHCDAGLKPRGHKSHKLPVHSFPLDAWGFFLFTTSEPKVCRFCFSDEVLECYVTNVSCTVKTEIGQVSCEISGHIIKH